MVCAEKPSAQTIREEDYVHQELAAQDRKYCGVDSVTTVWSARYHDSIGERSLWLSVGLQQVHWN